MYVCVCVTTTYVHHAAIRQYPSSCATAQLFSPSSPTPSTKSSIQASVAFLALMHRNTQRLRRGRDASRRGPQVQEFGFQLLCQQIVAKVHQKLYIVTNCLKFFGWFQCQCPAKSGWHELQDSLVATPVMGRSRSTQAAWKRGIVGPNKQIRHVSSVTPSLPRPAPKLPRREELAIHDWAQACATLSHPKRHILDGSQLCREAVKLEHLGLSWRKHYCQDTHEARTTKQQLQGLRDKSQWDSLSLSDGEEKKGDILVKSKMQIHALPVWPKTKMYKQTIDIQPWLAPTSAQALWGKPFECFFRPKHWWSSSTGGCSPVA